MTALPPKPKRIPPLENGDHLKADEFHRRYEAMPENVKAELIEGIVYMSSPVRLTQHGRQQFRLIGWLFAYVAATPMIEAGDNTTVKFDSQNEPQPDVLLFVDPAARDGAVTINDAGYVVGPPDLVAEVAGSSVSIDRNEKLRVYQRFGVREYLMWRVEDEAIDWFTLRGETYHPLPPDPADGLLKSGVFPGLWLDAAALLRGDLAGVLAALQRGLATPDHAAFAARLLAAGRPPG